MNYKMVLSILGRVLVLEAVLLLCPMLIGIIYSEEFIGLLSAYLIPAGILALIGIPLSLLKSKEKSIYVKEGFVVVALAWILLSAFGALPFVLSGAIPNYINAFFETVSGFTTTGCSVINDYSVIPKSIFFWRSLTQFLGGMGILVFVLALVPGGGSGTMHVFRSESPGPSVGKLVSKITHTARILYGIYLAFTVLLIILLLAGGEMDLFDSVVHALSVAGTGGFSSNANSVVSYGTYTQIIMAIFMLIFATNFNFYYLILIKNVKKALLSEEVRAYFIIVAVSTLMIAVNVITVFGNFGEALKHAFFQVASISSTTGMASADYNVWPEFSRAIIIAVMAIGACGGSTGGGLKVSRLVMLLKSFTADLKRKLHPRAVVNIKFEGELLDKQQEIDLHSYFFIYVLIIAISVILLSLDPIVQDFASNFSATITCLNNVGPGVNLVGPMSNFSAYSPFSKILLSGVMLIGRLEIFPMLILFAPRTWKRG